MLLELTYLDSFLWGGVKRTVFFDKINSLANMNEGTDEATADISTELLENLSRNICSRANQVVKKILEILNNRVYK